MAYKSDATSSLLGKRRIQVDPRGVARRRGGFEGGGGTILGGEESSRLSFFLCPYTCLVSPIYLVSSLTRLSKDLTIFKYFTSVKVALLGFPGAALVLRRCINEKEEKKK